MIVVQKYSISGQNLSISSSDLFLVRNVWQCISRSPRSTCQRSPIRKEREAEVRGASQEERITSAASGVRSAWRDGEGCGVPAVIRWPVRHGATNGVPRKPRGAGELRLTGHSGFSAFPTTFCTSVTMCSLARENAVRKCQIETGHCHEGAKRAAIPGCRQ